MLRALVGVAAAAVALSDTVMLPMRDGVKLHTEFDLPPFHPAGKRIAAVLERSPYGANAEELIADLFGETLGYASVRQDMRGTKQSEGQFGIWHDSQSDAYDTMDWITNQTWSNGIVFTTGASADAIDELAQLSGPHPALRGQLNIFATSEGWETFYPGGAYREALIDGWLKSTVPTQYKACDALVRAEEQPGAGSWWDKVNGSLYYQNVNWPSMMWAGWYDIFQEGNLAAWNGANKLSDPSVRGQSKLVVDPCGHCQAAANLFPHDLIFGRVLLPILMAFDMMSNESPTNKTWPPVPEGAKPVTFYVMGDDQNGAPGNFWTSLDDFPAPARTPYYLLAGGAGPGSGALAPQRAGAGAAALSFSADPSDPVHTIGGNNLLIPCGPLDQRPIEALGRQDVLIFTAPPLTEALAVVGLVTATLHFSTDVVDTDFVVKLVDVYPSPDPANPALAGESILVADGIARARWREFPATDEPQLLSGAPGDVYTVHVSLWSTAYVFAPGHSVRVHVQPSNYPRFFPNDNTGTPMSKVSPSTPNVTAHTTLYANATLASAVVLPVVPLSALPPFDVAATVDAMLARWTPRWEANVRTRTADDVDMKAWLQRRAGAALQASTEALRNAAAEAEAARRR